MSRASTAILQTSIVLIVQISVNSIETLSQDTNILIQGQLHLIIDILPIDPLIKDPLILIVFLLLAALLILEDKLPKRNFHLMMIEQLEKKKIWANN